MFISNESLCFDFQKKSEVSCNFFSKSAVEIVPALTKQNTKLHKIQINFCPCTVLGEPDC